jgi:hypothetical protein
MDLARSAEFQLRLTHRHSDGSWSELEPRPHDAAERDPEQRWGASQLYVCRRCDEQVLVETSGDSPSDPPR